MVGRIADKVVLSDEERRFLEAQVWRHKAARSLSDRCRIILLRAEGLQSKEIAGRLEVHEHPVGKWRRRFVKGRIEGLTDEYRPGRPRTVSDEQVAEVIKPRCNPRRRMRSIGRSAQWRVRRACRIRPSVGYGPRSACNRTDPRRSICQPIRCSWTRRCRISLGLYLSPPNRAIILCVDEKSRIHALDREQPVLPMAPVSPSGEPIPTSATARPRSVLRWISLRASDWKGQ